MSRPELLIPAGNLEKLRTAVLYGADAVYVGVEGLSLRAKQAEFNLEDLAQGTKEAHGQGVKVYGALNVFARNRDLDKIPPIVDELVGLGIDGVIISDPGFWRLLDESNPVSRFTLALRPTPPMRRRSSFGKIKERNESYWPGN